MPEQGGTVLWDFDADTSKFDQKLTATDAKAKGFTKSLEQGSKQASSELGNAGKAATGFGNRLQQVASGVTSFGSGVVSRVQNIGNAFEDVSGKFKVAGIVAAGAFGLMSKFSLDMVRSVQRSTVSLTAYVGSAKTAAAITKQLIEFAKSDRGVLFNRDELLNITTRLAGLRKEGLRTQNQLVGFIKSVAPAAAVFKNNAGSAEYFGEILGQILGTGKLLTQDYRQLANAGVILDRSLIGQTISAEQLREALMKAVPASILDKQAQTVDGQIIRLKTSFRELGNQLLGVRYGANEFGASFAPGSLGDQAMRAVADFTALMRRDDIKASFARMGSEVGKFVREAVPQIVSGFKWIADNIDTVIEGIKLFAKAWIAVKIGGFISSVLRLGWAVTNLGGFMVSGVFRAGEFALSLLGVHSAAEIAAGSVNKASGAMVGARAASAGAAGGVGKMGTQSGLAAVAGSRLATVLGAIPGWGWAIAAAAAAAGGAFYLYNKHQKEASENTAKTSMAIQDLATKLQDPNLTPDKRAQIQGQIQILNEYGKAWQDLAPKIADTGQTLPVTVKGALDATKQAALAGTAGVVQTSLGTLRVLPNGAGVEFYRLPGAITPGMTQAQLAAQAIAEATKNGTLAAYAGIPTGTSFALAGLTYNLANPFLQAGLTATNTQAFQNQSILAQVGLLPAGVAEKTASIPGIVRSRFDSAGASARLSALAATTVARGEYAKLPPAVQQALGNMTAAVRSGVDPGAAAAANAGLVAKLKSTGEWKKLPPGVRDALAGFPAKVGKSLDADKEAKSKGSSAIQSFIDGIGSEGTVIRGPTIEVTIKGKGGRVQGKAKGGFVQRFAKGGMVNYLASGGIPNLFKPQGTDTVPAMLTPGEFVMSLKGVRTVQKFLDLLNTGQIPAVGGGGVTNNFYAQQLSESDIDMAASRTAFRLGQAVRGAA